MLRMLAISATAGRAALSKAGSKSRGRTASLIFLLSHRFRLWGATLIETDLSLALSRVLGGLVRTECPHPKIPQNVLARVCCRVSATTTLGTRETGSLPPF
jgi:hypothetical protein